MMNDESTRPRPPRGRITAGPTPVRQPSPVFTWPTRVYHEDTDGSGVVYHANYLKFLERARTEWLRSLGFEQPDLAAREQVAFVVRSVAIDFLKPAVFNDALAVTVEPERVSGGELVLSQRVMRETEAIASARVSVACVNTASFRPVRIPDSLAQVLSRHTVRPEEQDSR